MNYMEDVAKMLGVEIGEEFYILTDKSRRFSRLNETLKFVLTESGLKHMEKRALQNYDYVFTGLLMGKYCIEKMPFEPREGERYYTFVSYGFDITCPTWNSLAVDYARKAAGMVFRTAEEAEKARPAIYEKLTGKVWCE